LAWHPTNAEWALSIPRYDTSLYVTKDFGVSWKLVAENVYQYSWGDAGSGTISQDRIYMIVESDEKGPYGFNYLAFTYTEDYGTTQTVALGRSYAFLFLDKQLFVLSVCKQTAFFDFFFFYFSSLTIPSLDFYFCFLSFSQYLESTNDYILKVTPDLGTKMRKFYDAEFPFGDELQNNVTTLPSFFLFSQQRTRLFFFFFFSLFSKGIPHFGRFDWSSVHGHQSRQPRFALGQLVHFKLDWQRIRHFSGAHQSILLPLRLWTSSRLGGNLHCQCRGQLARPRP
jgi:hypothetical protein